MASKIRFSFQIGPPVELWVPCRVMCAVLAIRSSSRLRAGGGCAVSGDVGAGLDAIQYSRFIPSGWLVASAFGTTAGQR